MTAKREAVERLEDIVTLAERVIAKARAAQAAVSNITDAPPERKDEDQ
jgi:hypothetical protein